MRFYIKEARERIGLSQKDLAKKLNLKPTTFNGYETGAHDPKSNILAKIATELRTTTDYLLGLTNNPEIPSPEHSFSLEYIGLASKYSRLDAHGKDMVDIVLDREYTRSISIKEAAEDSDDKSAIIASIPYAYDLAASAGLGEYAMDIAHFETVGLSETPPRGADFLIRIDGDSMEPKYSHNDKVYIKRQDAVNEGEIGLFYLDGNVYIKKQGYDKLISLNPDYDPVPVAEDATSKCFGKVLGKCQSNIIEL